MDFEVENEDQDPYSIVFFLLLVSQERGLGESMCHTDDLEQQSCDLPSVSYVQENTSADAEEDHTENEISDKENELETEWTDFLKRTLKDGILSTIVEKSADSHHNILLNLKSGGAFQVAANMHEIEKRDPEFALQLDKCLKSSAPVELIGSFLSKNFADELLFGSKRVSMLLYVQVKLFTLF
ncbi:uncharacterized protein LOC130656128 [Hydractinia symbiolongicarpus]|uniref:uncharacterized protein LOC130656128 n=1 Tax=Hydractinia symbiolongicarpus TaxID=13093 RepID=UPI00255185F6|nr:uncharacterized protein LOC130656128 [Hydractinia symbiolongicarpus]